MEANELRVGNIIYNVLNKPITVEWLQIKHAKDFMPVPLTPEILEKAGFIEEEEETFGIKYFNKGEVSITDDFQLSGQKMLSMKHLHQLQNLYFVLTGEELEINL